MTYYKKNIAKLNKITTADYPLEILKTYSSEVKLKLAEQALESKDYASLEHVLKVVDYTGGLMHNAFDKLDVEAVKLIIKAEENLKIYDEFYIRNLFEGDDNQNYFFDKTELKEKRKEILKLLLNAKIKDNISFYDLQVFANVVSPQEFEEFCKSKELDVTNGKFKDLELLQYKISKLEQMIKIEEVEVTILNLLLSRSYSDKITLPELRKIYTKLYNLDSIAKEMLTYTAALISQGNTIKILFSKGSDSFYDKYSNIIKVDNMFINEKIFNTESVLIHEIGHFVYEQIFDFNAAPFNMIKLKEFVKGIHDKYKDYIEDPFMSASLSHKVIYEK